MISGYFNGVVDAVAGNAVVPAALQTYDPAENKTYELGWKAEWLNRRLSTELSAYMIDYTGIQIPATPPAPLITNLVQNVGNATGKGFELTVNFRVSDAFTVGGTYSYTPTEFDSGTVDAGVLRYCGGSSTTIPTAALGFCPSLVFRGNNLPDVSGKPQVLLMLERLIEHISGHDGVKWATFNQIADDFKFRQRPALPDVFDDAFLPPEGSRKIE